MAYAFLFYLCRTPLWRLRNQWLTSHGWVHVRGRRRLMLEWPRCDGVGDFRAAVKINWFTSPDRYFYSLVWNRSAAGGMRSCDSSGAKPPGLTWVGILLVPFTEQQPPVELVSQPWWGLSDITKITWGNLWQSRDPWLVCVLYCHLVPLCSPLQESSSAAFCRGHPWLRPCIPCWLQGAAWERDCSKYHTSCKPLWTHGTRQKRFIPLFLLEKRGWESESFHANVTQLLLNCQNKWQKWGKWHQIKNVTGDRFMSSTVAAAKAGERDTVITQH